MDERIKYEYDEKYQVMIKCSSKALPRIIRKSDPVWRDFGPQDEPYERAVFLGQGCWERLDTIGEEQAKLILAQWGYKE